MYPSSPNIVLPELAAEEAGICLQVASRAGLPLNFLLLDGNQYCLLWPQHDGCSPSLLIDPYHNGDLLASEEVKNSKTRA
jgi:hypothetical protein